jgi:hypothetical protein
LEIAANIVVHFALPRIPPPSSIVIDGDILEGIEPETRQSLDSLAVAASFDIAVP